MRDLVRWWLDYQNAGTPYGNTFEGFMEWCKEQVLQRSLDVGEK